MTRILGRFLHLVLQALHPSLAVVGPLQVPDAKKRHGAIYIRTENYMILHKRAVPTLEHTKVPPSTYFYYRKRDF